MTKGYLSFTIYLSIACATGWMTEFRVSVAAGNFPHSFENHLWNPKAFHKMELEIFPEVKSGIV
jgi:hypothetical protein